MVTFSKQRRRPRQARHGAALMVCLFVLLVVSSLVANLLDTELMQFAATRNAIEYEQATYWANAGIQHVAAQLLDDSAWRGMLTDGNLPPSSAPAGYSAEAVDDGSGGVLVTSTGYSGSASERSKQPSPFDHKVMVDLPKNEDGRQFCERRDHRTRRRHAESRSVYIELCRSVLRVAIVTGESRQELPQLRTMTIPWRQNATELISSAGREELTVALRQLVAKEKLAGCRTSIALNSTLCVNRASSGSSAKVEQEIESLEGRSQHYLALGAGDKVTAVARKQTDARHLHALVTVANSSTLHLIVEAAEAAGLAVGVVESGLVSVCRLQGILGLEDEPVVLAQLDDDRYEVGVSRQGQLLLEYRPAGDAKLENLSNVIDDHRERMQRYCRRQYGIGDMKLGRMFLVGEQETIAKLGFCSVNSESFDSLIAKAAPGYWRTESQAPTSEMSATLGLALRDQLSGIAAAPNLMEHILAEARTPLRPFLTRAVASVAAVLLIALGLGIYNWSESREIAQLQAAFDELQPRAQRSQQLGLQLRQFELEARHLRDLDERAPHVTVAPLVRQVGQCLPKDVWLTRLTLDGDTGASVAGASYSKSGVYEFVRYLDQAPWFGDVALRGTENEQTEQGPATAFDLNLQLAPLSPKESTRE